MSGFSYLWNIRQPNCHWCGASIRRLGGADPSAKAGNTDHLVPQAWGGRDDPENLVLSCRRCNERRAAAGHCIAALRCAEAVIGASVGSGEIRKFYRFFKGLETGESLIAERRQYVKRPLPPSLAAQVEREAKRRALAQLNQHTHEEGWTTERPPVFLPPPYAAPFSGLRMGPMTVLGYGAPKWVVSCNCGLFAYKSTKFVAKHFVELGAQREELPEQLAMAPAAPEQDGVWSLECPPIVEGQDGVAAPVGTKINRLTVLGLARPRGNGARWVVRCDCGNYGINKAKFLRSERAKERAMCRACDVAANPQHYQSEKCKAA